PIEYCIAEGIRRYEAGAQGEHKLARGFTPTPTHSSHWLRDPAFHRAVGEFLAAEQEHVGYYMDELNEHAPYRRSPMPGSR
ncbi:MAG TPA: peptidogalycan biosysnthesis protein, partial [Burkholderiales bacterium]